MKHQDASTTKNLQAGPLRKRRRDGVTLVEILVTAGIIGFLAALLFPAYKSITHKSKLAGCMNNQRQITTAYLSYVNDNDGSLWYRTASGGWVNGSGALFGAQDGPNTPGRLCALLEPYGLKLAKFNAWNTIPDRAKTVWYCPTTYNRKEIDGHGSTYFYRNLGVLAGITDRAAKMSAVSDYIGKEPYLYEYYGNHMNDKALYSASAPGKMVYSYLDGHSEFR